MDTTDLQAEVFKIINEHEGDFLAVQERVQGIVDANAEAFIAATKALEEEFKAMPEAAATDFMKQYRTLETAAEEKTRAELDVVVREVQKDNPA